MGNVAFFCTNIKWYFLFRNLLTWWTWYILFSKIVYSTYYVPTAVLTAWQILMHSTFKVIIWEWYFMIPIIQAGKLRHRLVSYLAQSPLANKWYSLGLNLITLVPESLLISCLSYAATWNKQNWCTKLSMCLLKAAHTRWITRKFGV